ncbi:MAG TPA: helix-turn-helix domain-containing protein [Armatimonadota bacterium]|nr:helix-turn-helix domain-containing protein [Armatimonadota bacterium]
MLLTPIENNLGNQYVPDEVSAPGETLQEVLEERRMTQTELAERLGLAHKTVNQIIRGKAPLTYATALGLETVLGIPASFWTAYETAYRESLTRKEVSQKLAEYTSWLNELPWKKAMALGWIRPQPSHLEQMMEILRFFGVASPKQYQEVYGSLAVQWKRSMKFPIDPGATAFWLRRGELDAAELERSPNLEWKEYDPREFERRLEEARALTREREPACFVPALQRLCALSGVAVVFVPELAGTRAGGAARWLSPGRALIQLSLRYKTNDHLWFRFYHEAAHVLKHSKKRVFLEQDKQDPDDQEREADEFAQDFLIPPREYRALGFLGKPSKEGVERFAARIGIDAGVVVGRLQNDQVIPRNWFNDLKQRYEWDQADPHGKGG